VIFFVATAYLLGRQYFELAPCVSIPPTGPRRCARPTRSRCSAPAWLIAAFVSVPILNLATPLFGTALMVHVHQADCS